MNKLVIGLALALGVTATAQQPVSVAQARETIRAAGLRGVARGER